MEDDLDDLLTEVEDKFCASKISQKDQSKFPHSNMKSFGQGKTGNVKSRDTDLNAMIDDIIDDSHNPKELSPRDMTQSKPGTSAKPSSMPRTKNLGCFRCFPVLVGGCACPQGLTTAVNQRCCDRLRCTDCDFRISTFDNYTWHGSTDYLFLRNNMPDFHRLKSKLVSRKGYRAYACQCKSRSVKDMIELETERDLKWVCGKH